MHRRARLDAYLDANDLDAVWFARPNSFAWLTGGDNVVDRTGDVGVAAAGYDGRRVVVVTDSIEAPRLRDEELAEGVAVEAFDWYDGSLADAVAERTAGAFAADFDVPGAVRVDASALRQPLSTADVDTYRDLGRDAAEAFEAVCRGLTPRTTEREAAVALREALGERDCETPVALVGGAKRAQRYRHLTPTDRRLGAYALVSATTERGGLYASLTRTVAFDPPDWLTDRHAAARRVETSALAATRRVARDDGVAGDVFDAIRAAYTTVGFEGEWREHHQGGAAGFAGREWIATPDSTANVTLPMAYAWNPTVQGTKSEDTHLVTDEGVERLTATGDWPTRETTSVDDGLTLDRPAVLQQ
ncbi:M24 family metallopeptidase [Halomarina oriensis]|uniref:M24 family metallopeptidase n=1 Tax=Halomarina oriensis TaxID=671145 RepID=A0A6B0GNV0_9EURY|nr:M24 family metallopeptidase [Halomarina oriensis]MWG36360.1 M24 family metallopeptidase [Halomarina oriensis]